MRHDAVEPQRPCEASSMDGITMTDSGRHRAIVTTRHATELTLAPAQRATAGDDQAAASSAPPSRQRQGRRSKPGHRNS